MNDRPQQPTTGPWRWELQIRTGPNCWEIHSSSALAAADTAEHLARRVADEYLKERPAELAETLWRALVWASDQSVLTRFTARAVVGPTADGTVGSWPGQALAAVVLQGDRVDV